jgi:hypothetical protein
MNDVPSPDRADAASRRAALHRLFALVAAPGVAMTSMSACGGGGAGSDPIKVGVPPAPVPTPAPQPPAPPPVPVVDSLSRLKTALATAPLRVGTTAVSVSQGAAQSTTSSFGSDAQYIPPLPQDATHNLATISQVYGYRRDLWSQLAGGVIASQQVVPVAREHVANQGRAGLHFVHTGSAFEVLVGGVNISATLVVDGQYVGTSALAAINQLVPTGLASPNTLLKFDFGVLATRRISLYLISSRGPCGLVIAAGDTLTAYDRSAEASFGAMSDSYGGAFSDTWGEGGLFYEAAAQLGIPHMDLDQIGGTGYAVNNGSPLALQPANAFAGRLDGIVNGLPDLFVTAGSINDNNRLALPPYATGDEAKAGFAAAVSGYYTNLRASLPNAVLAAVGPWQPPVNLPASAGELDKAAVIKAALRACGGRWIYLDNVNGGWINSAGASAAPSANDGPWQTVANAAAYIDIDNVHPNKAGCAYLGTRFATALRAAILAL